VGRDIKELQRGRSVVGHGEVRRGLGMGKKVRSARRGVILDPPTTGHAVGQNIKVEGRDKKKKRRGWKGPEDDVQSRKTKTQKTRGRFPGAGEGPWKPPV